MRITARVAATANVTLVGEQSIDGQAAREGWRVFTPNQTAKSERRVWVVKASPNAWVPVEDMDHDSEIECGMEVKVAEGTVYGGAVFELVTPMPYLGGDLDWRTKDQDGFSEVIGSNRLPFTTRPDVGGADTVVIGGDTYEFKSRALTNDAFLGVEIGPTASDTLANLIAAINAAAAAATGMLKTDELTAALKDGTESFYAEETGIYGMAGTGYLQVTAASGPGGTKVPLLPNKATVATITAGGSFDEANMNLIQWPATLPFGVNPSADDTITIGGETYQFEPNGGEVTNDLYIAVEIGVDAAATLLNLVAAIDATAASPHPNIVKTDHVTPAVSIGTQNIDGADLMPTHDLLAVYAGSAPGVPAAALPNVALSASITGGGSFDYANLDAVIRPNGLPFSVNPTEDDTVVIGGDTYEFHSLMVSNDAYVGSERAATAAAALTTLVRQINATPPTVSYLKKSTGAAAILVGTENINAVEDGTALVLRNSDEPGGDATADLNNIATAASITGGGAFTFANMNLVGSQASADRMRTARTEVTVTANMIAHGTVEFDLGFTATAWEWGVRTAGGAVKTSGADTMAHAAGVMTLTLNGGGGDCAATDVVWVRAYRDEDSTA